MGCVIVLGLMTAETSAAPRNLVFATLNAPPYFGENLAGGGFYTEISREAFQRVGYTFEVEFMTWNRALELAKRGDYAGMLGMYITLKNGRTTSSIRSRSMMMRSCSSPAKVRP